MLKSVLSFNYSTKQQRVKNQAATFVTACKLFEYVIRGYFLGNGLVTIHVTIVAGDMVWSGSVVSEVAVVLVVVEGWTIVYGIWLGLGLILGIILGITLAENLLADIDDGGDEGDKNHWVEAAGYIVEFLFVKSVHLGHFEHLLYISVEIFIFDFVISLSFVSYTKEWGIYYTI